MNSNVHDEQVRFAAGMNFSVAFWQIASPFMLGYSGSLIATLDAVISGVLVLALSWMRLRNPEAARWAGWLTALLGAWIFVSAFLLMQDWPGAYWNDIAIGIIVFGFGVWAGMETTA